MSVLARTQEETSKRQEREKRVSIELYSDLLRTRDAVIFDLARLAESRDPDTGNHLERVALYSTRLASVLRRDPRYRRQLTSSFVKLIGISSALHDIGKVGIKDSILLKPGKFDEQERFIMQAHTEIGGKCVRQIESRLGRSNFLQMARKIALCHHERWDGTGYPKGLAGEEIPLAARIVAIADVYDALSTQRVYKPALRHRQCVEAIRDAAGTQFDPAIVDVFLEMESEFHDIARTCVDSREARDTGSASARDTADITPATESSPDHALSVALALLEQCNDGPPAATPTSRYELDSVLALSDRSSNSTVNPAITNGLSDNDRESENVLQKV